MCTSVPASLTMGVIGRKAGFQFAALVGVLGACLALFAIYQHSFWIFCLATFCFGAFSAFGNYYRFTAPEVVPEDKKPVAISWVMAGGVVAAFIGPNLANWSQNLLSISIYAGAFVIAIAVYLASFVTVSFMDLPPPEKEREGKNHGRPLGTIAAQPAFIVSVLCATVGYGVMNLLMTATPLAMHHYHMNLSDTAFIIQWHVVAMFAPSFFTGHLIGYFGIRFVLRCGAAVCLLSVFINLAGQSVWHFWIALMFLGVGWNFLFVGGTTLLTDTYAPQEKSRAQAMNDFIVFSTVSVTALSSGTIHHHFGWIAVNLSVIPFLILITACISLMLTATKRDLHS